MKIGLKKLVEIDVTELEVHVKVRDEGCYSFFDQHGDGVEEVEGNVPSWFPGDHFGDYLIFRIELATGKILNWEAPDRQDLMTTINGEEE